MLDESGFTCSGYRPFTKNNERIQKFKETEYSRYIYQNELDKACFQHDMAYADFKDLTRRTVSDKILPDKVFNIAKDPKYDGYQRGLPSMFYNFFDRKTSGGAATLANKSAIKNENISNKELGEKSHKTIIIKFKKRKVNSTFIDNIWGADPADMQLISKLDKGICFL